jgi:hypothetical protein
MALFADNIYKVQQTTRALGVFKDNSSAPSRYPPLFDANLAAIPVKTCPVWMPNLS